MAVRDRWCCAAHTSAHGGSALAVNLVGNANYSAGVQTLESLTEDDESRLWTMQKAVVHALGEVYKGRRQQQG